MSNKEMGWGSERGLRLFNCANTAVHVASERLTLQILDLAPPSLPICTEQDACDLEEFLPRAKEGFALHTASNELELGQIEDFLSLTTPFTVGDLRNRLKLTDKQNTLPEYWQAISSLGVLSAARKISFFSFVDPPDNLTYDLGMAESYWIKNTNTEGIWSLLEELDKLTRDLLYTDRIQTRDLLKIGHFYMASREIAKIFSC